jgi:hypothetical protein
MRGFITDKFIAQGFGSSEEFVDRFKFLRGVIEKGMTVRNMKGGISGKGIHQSEFFGG